MEKGLLICWLQGEQGELGVKGDKGDPGLPGKNVSRFLTLSY